MTDEAIATAVVKNLSDNFGDQPMGDILTAFAKVTVFLLKTAKVSPEAYVDILIEIYDKTGDA